MAPEIAIDASRADLEAKTGTEWYSWELLHALIALPDRPPLALFHRKPPDDWPESETVRHVVIPRSRLWTHIGLSGAMRRERPAVLFVPSHVLPLLHPAKSVVTVHDLGYLKEHAAHTRRSRLELDATTRWNARSAHTIITVSSQTRSDLIAHYHIPPAKVRVIASGVNHQRFKVRAGKNLHNPAGISGPYLLFLSTVQPRKNVIRLVEAFESLGRDDLSLVIAGKSGWLSDPIEERIRTSPLCARIIRLGFVPDQDIPTLYNRAQAFILPSLYEGFGMGVLEAMASGCPVVTSNLSSLPEVAGGAAILVDPHDTRALRDGIAAAIDPANRERLVAAGLAHAARFTWERTARETMQVLVDAIHER